MDLIANAYKKARYKFPVTELMLLMVALFWGTSYGLTKSVLIYTSVLLFIALRFSLTFLCMLPMVISDFRKGLNNDWKIAIPTGCILSAIFYCEVFGVLHTTASNAAFLISLSIVLTALAEPIINKKRISKALILLTVTSVLGIFFLTSTEEFELVLNKGDYFILLAALLRALMVTTTKRSTENKKITTRSLTAIQSFIVAISSLIALALFSTEAELSIPTVIEFWLIMSYLIIFCTLFAFYIQNYAVRRTSPTRVSLLMGSESLFGAIFAIIWLNESLTPLQIFGGSLIFVSVVITSLQKTE